MGTAVYIPLQKSTTVLVPSACITMIANKYSYTVNQITGQIINKVNNQLRIEIYAQTVKQFIAICTENFLNFAS